MQRDERFDIVLAYLSRIAVRMVEELAQKQADGEADSELRALTRRAFVREPKAALRAPLRSVKCFPTTTTRVSIDDLVALERPICFATSRTASRAPDGRPVVVVLPDEPPALASALRQWKLPSVCYDRGLELAASGYRNGVRGMLEAALRTELEAQGITEPLMFWFESPSRRGYIAPSRTRMVLRHHLGERIVSSPRPIGIGTTCMAIDEDDIVPSSDWARVLWPTGLLGLLEADRKFCWHVVEQVEEGKRELSSTLESYLRQALTDLMRNPQWGEGDGLTTGHLLTAIRGVLPPVLQTPAPASVQAPAAAPAKLKVLKQETETELDLADLIEEASKTAAPSQPTDPLEQALLAALMRFPPSSHATVTYEENDHLLRYDARKATLRVGTQSELWKALRRRSSDVLARRHLTAAAMSEINRELEAVTDAEERRALVQLMAR